MKSPIIIIAILSCLLAISLALKDSEWESFKIEFNRKYKNPAEEAFRKKIFLDNKMTIDQHNKRFEEGQVTFTMGINQFADMTNQEFNEEMNCYEMPANESSVPLPQAALHQIREVNLSTGKDWRDDKCVTDVKNQANCLSCWAFAATGAIESMKCIFSTIKHPVPLSEQNLIDCSAGFGNHGCNMGTTEAAFEYIKRNGGIDTESSYPYEAADGVCRYNETYKGAAISDYGRLYYKSEASLQIVVDQQPVAVGVDASQPTFAFYEDGIYSDPYCSSTEINHAMLVVGYDVDSTTLKEYWIVKNSYGTAWGNLGYIYMAKNMNNMCGIATRPSYPLVPTNP